jgi:hypothetical protein
MRMALHLVADGRVKGCRGFIVRTDRHRGRRDSAAMRITPPSLLVAGFIS